MSIGDRPYHLRPRRSRERWRAAHDGALVCVIEHERALYGDPLMEAGFVATAVDGLGDPASFLRGYGWTPRTRTERTRRRLYNLHQFLIMVIETAYRGHAVPTQYDWAPARLDETMATFGHHA